MEFLYNSHEIHVLQTGPTTDYPAQTKGISKNNFMLAILLQVSGIFISSVLYMNYFARLVKTLPNSATKKKEKKPTTATTPEEKRRRKKEAGMVWIPRARGAATATATNSSRVITGIFPPKKLPPFRLSPNALPAGRPYLLPPPPNAIEPTTEPLPSLPSPFSVAFLGGS